MAITQDITNIKLNSIDDGCRELANILGLRDPVTTDVLISAVQSEEYARNLLTCRETPDFLQALLDNPSVPASSNQMAEKDSLTLLKGIANSLVRWGKVGFSVAKEDEVERRLNACVRCKHIRFSESKHVVYKVLKSQATCGLCGCDVEKKARMNSEMCPGQDPKNPEFNYWGQIIALEK